MRFLLATGWGAAIDPGEARTKGVEAVLSKPYQLADLLRVLTSTDRAPEASTCGVGWGTAVDRSAARGHSVPSAVGGSG